MKKQEEEFIKLLKEEIDNAEEDCANLDWISKELKNLKERLDKLSGEIKEEKA